MRNKFLYIIAGAVITSCSSQPKTELEKTAASNVGEERIISRIDNLKDRPSWLIESEPFRIESGKVMSLGQTMIPATDNLNAAYRIAESNSKASVSHAISQRLDYVFQDAQEGTASDTTQSRFIGATASQLTTSALKITRRYWEKVAIVQESGQVLVQYRVFALSEMEEPQFKSAVLDAVRKSQGKQGISAEFSQKVETHWQKFTGSQPNLNERNPTSSPKE